MLRSAPLPLPLLPLLLALVGAGCRPPEPQFRGDELLRLRLERESAAELEEAARATQAILLELFGTPDQPRIPESLSADPELAAVVDPERLGRAAGPAGRDAEGRSRGLYREQCARCHGISGDGRGVVASMMNPYPRDFRSGVFKFKSTRRGARPTRDDLRRVLRHGIPGTAMPAFANLERERRGEQYDRSLATGGHQRADASSEVAERDDLEVLVDYVILLAMRGQVERQLMQAAAFELEELSEEIGEEIAVGVARSWARAEEEIVAVPDPEPELPVEPDGTEEWLASVRRGGGLFGGAVANCAACHGRDGSGDVAIGDVDDWTKEWTTRMGIEPSDRAAVRRLRRAGAMPPRTAQPRDLRPGVFRGGAAPQDVYRRIVVGIEGTPMPGVNLVEHPSPAGLTEQDVWDLVNYVRSMGSPPRGPGNPGAETTVDRRGPSGAGGRTL